MLVVLVLISSALYALGFPPWSLAWVAWIALIPFFSALLGSSAARGCVLGGLWGTVTIWLVAFWVPAALAFYYQQSWGFSLTFCVLSSIVFWGTFYAAFGAAAGWMSGRTPRSLRPPLLAALWVTCELARARLITGEPWALLGYALVPHPVMIQAADIGGVYLLSFAVALVNAGLAMLWLDAQRFPRWRVFPSGAVYALLAPLVLFAYGRHRLTEALPQSPQIPVAVVQGNNDLGAQWKPEFYGGGLDTYLRMTREAAAAGPKLIIWPESAVTFFLAREPRYQLLIARALTDTGADLVVGAPHLEDADPARPEFFNSAFHLTADGRLDGRYDKVRLLPFAEYFPLRTIELLRRNFERVRSFTPGAGDTLLDTPAGRAAVVICFEAIFPELVRRRMQAGADILLNLSNDAWLGGGAGPEQHAAIATLRAVENRTWLVRATTTGISSIVDPFGRVRAQTAMSSAAILQGTLVPLRVTSLYERAGDLFAFGCAAVTLMTAAALVVRSRPIG